MGYEYGKEKREFDPQNMPRKTAVPGPKVTYPTVHPAPDQSLGPSSSGSTSILLAVDATITEDVPLIACYCESNHYLLYYHFDH